MAFTEADKQAMDNAATDAENEIINLKVCNPSTDIDDYFEVVANWWKKWYMKAGHKRLARILLQYADKEGG